MNIVEKLEKNDCCGCSSCAQKCPKKAIEMIKSDEGFLYPKINKDKCINCGLCLKVCPQLDKIRKINNSFPKAYAMNAKDSKIRQSSSSGGLFTVIASNILDNNGVVYGAAYDTELKVKHIRVETKNELDLLKTSKYVQSSINNTYKEVEKDLKESKTVFFTGTPCQVNGLKTYLMKDYDNLITADFICHGVPSPKLFEKYLKYLSIKYKSKVKKYNFRSKEKRGWALVSKIETDDGKVYYSEAMFDPYYYNFIKGNTYRESCYKCHYTNINRVSDITLADYFAVYKVHPQFYKEDGVSLILINNEKGQKVINSLKNEIEFLDTSINKAAEYNENLIRPAFRPKTRDYIYNDIDCLGEEQYVKRKLKVKKSIKRIVKAMIPSKIKLAIKKRKNK